jgi:hypothetical protein
MPTLAKSLAQEGIISNWCIVKPIYTEKRLFTAVFIFLKSIQNTYILLSLPFSEQLA